MSPGEDGSWDSYGRLVVSEFDRLSKAIETMDNKLDQILNGKVSKLEVRLGMLEVKVMLIGAGASIVVTTAITVILHIAKLQ